MYHPPRYDRALLLGSKRNEVLTLDEVRLYGEDSFGDPDYVSVYGLSPAQWYARGVRLMGRTAVECTRDRLAGAMAADIAALAGAAGAASRLALDLFAGSGNTLYWITRETGARRGIGFELDPGVYQLASGNLARLGLGVELRPQDYASGLAALGEPDEDLLIVFLAPPWGDALREGAGLDLDRTQPPVAQAVDVVTGLLGRRRLLFAVQVYERVEPASQAALTTRFEWSSARVYGLNEPGFNHGLLLGTHGWSPAAGPA
jgi:predicted RNA methylase